MNRSSASYARDPFAVFCPSCGAPAQFDIVRQNYCCLSCGATVPPAIPVKQTQGFRNLRSVAFRKQAATLGQAVYSCSGCGANVVLAGQEGMANCGFCGRKLVRREFLQSDTFPEVIIPFFITEEEARDCLRRWCEKNRAKPEAKRLLPHLNALKGYYMPYQMVKGPVSCTVSRDTSNRKFHCGGYIDGIAVSSCKGVSNDVLEGMEPFDWSAAQPFSFNFLAGHRVRLQDMDAKSIERNVYGEVKHDYGDTVRKVMQTGAVDIAPRMDNLMILPALLPVYVIQANGVTAAVNGQTGRVSVKRNKQRKGTPWFVEPLLITLLVFLIGMLILHYPVHMVWAEAFMISGMLTLVVFAIAMTAYSNKKKERETWTVIYRGKEFVKGRTPQGVLRGKEPPPEYKPAPVFFENIGGVNYPVYVSFYPVIRVIGWMLLILLWNTFPLLLAFLFAGFNTSLMWFGGIVVWLCVSVPTTPAFIIRFFRQEVYEKPWFYAYLQGGKRGKRLKLPKPPRKKLDLKGEWPVIKFVLLLFIFPLIISLVIAYGGTV